MGQDFENRLQEHLLRNPEIPNKKSINEQRAIDASEPYSKEAKLKELQDYFKKAQECMQVLVQEVGEIKSLEELTAKKPTIKAIYNDLQSSLCQSLDPIIYGY